MSQSKIDNKFTYKIPLETRSDCNWKHVLDTLNKPDVWKKLQEEFKKFSIGGQQEIIEHFNKAIGGCGDELFGEGATCDNLGIFMSGADDKDQEIFVKELKEVGLLKEDDLG